jgi:hypothetical protein
VYISYYIYIIGYKQHPRRKMDEVNVATPIMATPKKRPSTHNGNAPNKASKMAHMTILTPRVIAFPFPDTFDEQRLNEYGSLIGNPTFAFANTVVGAELDDAPVAKR